MPHVQRLPDSDADKLPRQVIIDGHKQEYPEDITAVLLNEPASQLIDNDKLVRGEGHF